MNLSKLKELEDLKAELGSLSNKRGTLIQDKVSECIANAREDFKKFFSSKGFSVYSTGEHLVAKYKSFTVNLDFPKPDEGFIGYYSVWDLKVNDEKYLVVLNDLGKYPRFKATTYPTPKTEDEKIQVEINQIKQRIKDIEKDIEEIGQKPWGYGLRKEMIKDFNYPQYETFASLLENLFN
ncbi:hypothetical protein [Bacillus smithii]|uniref:hypothetical protein n=1 Tax=Bacillus smithii TaxID=1479 RepID=UPI002E1BE09E|nr:hypothetical protein [Bacillus smithii]MED4929029.1 hypothetical protein [Bacillus smithii]